MNRSTRWSLCVLALIWALPSTPSAQTPTPELATFDIRYLTTEYKSRPPDLDLPVWRLYATDPPEARSEALSSITADQLVEWLRESLGPKTWEGEHHSLHSNWQTLHVRNQRDVLDRVPDLLGYIRASLMTPVTLELYQVSAGRVDAGGPLDAAALGALIGQNGVVFKGRFGAIAGRPFDIRSTQRTALLTDYDVEVATESQVADPIMSVLEDGMLLQVTAVPLLDGRVRLDVAGRVSTIEKIDVRSFDSTWVGRVQLPVVDTQIIASAGVVDAGGGLLVGTAQGADDPLYLVRVVSVGAVPARPQGALAILPIGLAQRERVLGSPRYGNLEAVDLGLLGDYGGRETWFRMEGSALTDLIRTTLDPSGWDVDPARSVWSTDSHLFVMAPDSVLRATDALIRRLDAQVLRPFSLEFRVGRLDPTRPEVAGEGPDAGATLAGLLETRGYVSGMAGQQFRAVLGREQGFIKDHSAEIAQEAAIVDPVVSSLFSGLIVQGRASFISGGQLGLDAEFVVQDVVGEVAAFDGNANDVGEVDVPKTFTVRATVARTLEPDRWVVLQVSPRPNQGDVLAILVRARF